MLAASMIAGIVPLFRNSTIPKICYSEDLLFVLGLGLGLELAVRVRIAYYVTLH